MAFFKFFVAAGLLCLASADVSEIVGKNQYLPPSKGYNYDRPSIPFPSPTPFSRPTPTYQTPFSSRPTFQTPFPSARPTYQTPAPSYVPPVSTPRPVSVSRPLPVPAYRPNTGFQPGTAPSGNQGTFVGPTASGGEHDHHHHEPGMPYDFAYKVKDDFYGNDYTRNEVSDGDVIRGEYRVQLPDGRLQIVKYTADWKNGYNAEVSYQGTPTFPGGSGGGQFPSGGGRFPAGGSQSPNAYIPPKF